MRTCTLCAASAQPAVGHLGNGNVCTAFVAQVCLELQPYCRVVEMASLLRHACPVTCDACSTALPPQAAFRCVDRRPDCTSVALDGQCDREPLVHWRDCPVSCRICQTAVRIEQLPQRNCADSMPDCAEWADQGECGRNKDLLQALCPVSCEACGGELASTAARLPGRLPSRCVDHDPLCTEWAQRGECERNADPMFAACPRACGMCERSDGGEGGVGAGDGDFTGRGRRALEAAPNDAVGCVDDASNCAERVRRGECEAPRLRAAMVLECAASCGTCQQRQTLRNDGGPAAVAREGAASAGAAVRGGGGNGCGDRRRACEYWLNQGECKRVPEVSSESCSAMLMASDVSSSVPDVDATLSRQRAPAPLGSQSLGPNPWIPLLLASHSLDLQMALCELSTASASAL